MAAVYTNHLSCSNYSAQIIILEQGPRAHLALDSMLEQLINDNLILDFKSTCNLKDTFWAINSAH